MNYLAKAIRSATRDAIRHQNNAAGYARNARMWLQYFHKTADDLAHAAAWQKASANAYKWSRHYREKAIELTAEYEAAKAALVTVEGEYCQRVEGGYKRLYTSSKSVAITRVAARKATGGKD